MGFIRGYTNIQRNKKVQKNGKIGYAPASVGNNDGRKQLFFGWLQISRDNNFEVGPIAVVSSLHPGTLLTAYVAMYYREESSSFLASRSFTKVFSKSSPES